ncbi:protein phosphatase 1, regulatory subunit 3Ca isoform X1 [Silurus asotus]|uniref:Protein phosphatase 1 regulatory subunit n=1 Tax=Silurus asotus TaxID=30991 RepID=A0AAD5FTB3_SILAS|nr:protein phosphatase 1, regulatory subunit 3Ca isoform X1 [Silurus asotus]
MPVDMAVQLYITHSPPLHSFLSSYQDYRTRNLISVHCKPVRSCINSKNTHNSHNAGPNTPRHAWQLPEPKAKKKVVFADSKGMSLTAVRIFSPCENKIPKSPLQSHSLKLGGSLNTTQSRILEFRQPASDYLDFRNRLMKNSVCLESCTLQGHTLTGTVKVRNLSYEKSVCVRITFDSWKSYRDVACTFMNDVCGCRDTDTFFFMVEIPAHVPPQDSVEFCVSFTSDGKTHWDNNNGKNYSLVAKHDENKDNTDETDLFDQFRRQRNCDRISNEWKSWTTAIGAPYW